MRPPTLSSCLLLLALLPSLLAQWVTQTQIDEDTGYTVIDRVSYGPNGAARTTDQRVLSTIIDAADAGDAATTAPPRIVGQPGTATGVATIVFEFTSSDGNVYTATFTPSYQSPSPTIPPQVGTIISAPDWTFTQAATGVQANGALPHASWPLQAWGQMAAVVGAGMVLGGWWVL